MEKFRQFADESTGINPYIPIWGQTKTSLFQKTLGVPVLLARILLLIPSLTLFLGFTLLTELVFLEHLRIIIFSIFVNGLSRVILLCFGCIWISEILERSKLHSSAPKGRKNTFRKLAYTNRQGFCDILICASIYGDPEYLFIESSGAYLAGNSFAALLFTLGFKKVLGITHLTSPSKLKSTSSLRPLVVFMEEANTNGTCVLEWKNTEKIPDTMEMRELFGGNIESLVIKYELGNAKYGPQFTTGDPGGHLVRMICRITHFKVSLRAVSGEEIRSKLDSDIKTSKRNEEVGGVLLKDLRKTRRIDELFASIQSIHAKSGRLPVVRSGGEEAQRFIEYWEKTNRGKSV
ncbi:apicomplexan conserved protein with 2 or more transmembrane domains [Cryptosporidium felis]|nr:apicomplexan conserved protein with 2 or more transmembrane domains [Cryptosporidium felis]